MYVVDRDFGFAPNPFHGFCTLATCKPVIRKCAQVDDWVMGMGGSKLRACGRCVFAMRVTEKVTFDEYWSNPDFLDKRPVRNGSQKMMVGDNIYHHDQGSGGWQQANSHHSNEDGSINLYNLNRDTKADSVLISTNFYYFGKAAPVVPSDLLTRIGYRNRIGHRTFNEDDVAPLLEWLQSTFKGSLNRVAGEPFDFEHSEKRYSGQGSKVT